MPSVPTVERLLNRIRKSGDFPAMARTVGLISQLTSSADTSNSALADTILQDYGLTQKILRIVNTVAFLQYHQVTTVSRAVLLLGFDRIRSVATGLILFEHLQSQARTPVLADALNMSFFSALLGRSIAERTAFAPAEEGFISSLFHNLGRTLVAFYLPDALEEIRATSARQPEGAVQSVLGLSYSQLGIEIASVLNLPDKLAESMTPIAGEQVREGMNEAERLACVATLANSITEILAGPGEGQAKRQEIDRLVRSYGRNFAVLQDRVDEIIGQSLKALREDSSTFRIDLPGSVFLNGLGEWRIASLVSGPGAAGVAEASPAGALVAVGNDKDDREALEAPETILTQGLHEITSLLLGDCTPDDVLRVVLESIYRALGVGRTRVFLLVKDPAAPLARFRFGFGQSPTEMKGWFEVPVGGTEDIFGLALRQQKDLVIKDLSLEAVAHLVPEWYRQRLIPGRFVVLLPLVLDERSVGLFYIDGEQESVALLTPAVVNYLKVLRGQAALAIQKASRLAGRRR